MSAESFYDLDKPAHEVTIINVWALFVSYLTVAFTTCNLARPGRPCKLHLCSCYIRSKQCFLYLLDFRVLRRLNYWCWVGLVYFDCSNHFFPTTTLLGSHPITLRVTPNGCVWDVQLVSNASLVTWRNFITSQWKQRFRYELFYWLLFSPMTKWTPK